MTKAFTIASPMCWGNGAYLIHKELEHSVPGYRVLPYNPKWTFFPVALPIVACIRNASLVHTTPDYSIFFMRRNIPTVITFHGYKLDPFMKPYSSWLQRIHYARVLRRFTKIAVHKARAVTAVSRFTADIVRRDLGYNGPLQVIYNGIDTNRFQPAHRPHPNNDVRVMFSGNLTIQKGAQWLVSIARKLHSNISIFYTTGLRTSNSLPTRPNLIPIGRVSHGDMPGRYQQMDILLMPTVREGFGMAVLEAMACGLPVVASDCSAIPELLDDERGGFLCPVGDTVAFADRINMLAESVKLRREMGAYNREKASRQFPLEKMTTAYQRLFSELEC